MVTEPHSELNAGLIVVFRSSHPPLFDWDAWALRCRGFPGTIPDTEYGECENPTTRHLQVLTQSTVSGIGVSQQTQNPKNTETSTNVEATLFTTNKEGTNVM